MKIKYFLKIRIERNIKINKKFLNFLNKTAMTIFEKIQ